MLPNVVHWDKAHTLSDSWLPDPSKTYAYIEEGENIHVFDLANETSPGHNPIVVSILKDSVTANIVRQRISEWTPKSSEKLR